MAISVDRIRADVEAIARCTATPGNGATRPTFSPAWAEARAYVIAQAEAAGCEVRTDAAGNVHARPADLGWETPAWLVGSHIDSVPNGGDYDGVAGVVVAIELLRSAKEIGLPSAPIELIAFAEEEGTTFGLGMIGSRLWVGDIQVDELASLRNANGMTFLAAGAPYGVNPEHLASDRFDRRRYLGLIEVHIEQGPAMWAENVPLAVVTAIAGRKQYKAKMLGQANHAGSTPMRYRQDALVAAAKVISGIDAMAREQGTGTVATVGRIECEPNAVNVIPGIVRFTVDLRSGDAPALAACHERMNQLVIQSGVSFNFFVTEDQPPVQMDPTLCSAVRLAAGRNIPDALSGALHDSAILAAHLPTVMLFVPSKDGISHNPAEFSRVEDIAAAAEVVQRVVHSTARNVGNSLVVKVGGDQIELNAEEEAALESVWNKLEKQPTVSQLGEMDQRSFVGAIGHVFEHSPWIAERAWATRPFASRNDLHEKMRQVVATATPAEQEALIKAHPDLVGRLAREGSLTRESTAEQAAAGLAQLSADEVAAFEKYNAAYRERFGFPFVICARENKKEAILAAFPKRLQNSREQEVATALEEIYKIARLRLGDAIWE